MRRKKILLVESDPVDRSSLMAHLTESGHQVCAVSDGIAAFQKVARDHYDLVIAELNLPRMSGIDLLRSIRERKESLPVVVVSAHAGVNEAVEAMKLGAHDFVLKPLTFEMIEIITSQLPEGPTVRYRDKPDAKFAIITQDPEMERLLQEAHEIADSQASIFIQGESGTGKELFARYIHNCSNRRGRPFVAVNCSALPETLLESELFGH